MAAALVIRPYARDDRPAVRTIACDTADRGEPIESLPGTREAFADLLTGYYTDYEPQSTWVAESEGRIVGYLTGCLDSRRYWSIMLWRLAPRAAALAVGRGALSAGLMWRYAAAGAHAWLTGGFRRLDALRRYPAHFHVNVRREFRAHGLGRELVERFCGQAQAARLSGVHATVREDNARACRFFERMGFVFLGERPMVRYGDRAFQAGHSRVYGKAV